jgi:hypothetical protein
MPLSKNGLDYSVLWEGKRQAPTLLPTFQGKPRGATVKGIAVSLPDRTCHRLDGIPQPLKKFTSEFPKA